MHLFVEPRAALATNHSRGPWGPRLNDEDIAERFPVTQKVLTSQLVAVNWIRHFFVRRPGFPI
jgi:hypothetical protein